MSDDDTACQARPRPNSEPRPPSSGIRPSRGTRSRPRPRKISRPDQTARHPDIKTDAKREDSEERALRRIFAQKPMVVEARFLEEVARYTRECEKQVSVTGPAPGGYAIADPSPEQEMVGAGTSNVIDEFLYKLEKEECDPPQHSNEEISRPATAQSAGNLANPAPTAPTAPPPARQVGVRGAERLAEQVEELRAKMATVLRENRKLKETIEVKDQKIRKLLDDIERIRKDPNVMHPSILRLRKMGLNTPALAELGDRWAGYVLGRTSMAMEVGSFSFRNVFAAHATNGVLTEESFKTVLRQFEPSIKSDQLTRLWYFADEDGSGRIDLFEFMRMAGVNSNGEMTDEYYEVVTMHLYRKFHARGGVRRVYATADKNWDQHLNLAEFHKLVQVLLKDAQLTKREISQVFQRMNVSGSGMLSVYELEAALEAAGAKCHVSEAWVKETFHQLATLIQDAGLNIKSVFPPGLVVEKEFRDVALRFLTQLRPSQLDRLWKYLQATCADDAVQVRHAGGDRDRLPSDSVVAVVFGPTLTSSPNELSSPGLQGAGGAGYYGPAGGVGREVLEQLVQQLVRRAGDVSPDVCFDTLSPFITAEHFQEMLSTRLGLYYDPVKAKQVFKLIDSDRDSKITRLEFRLMFKALAPDSHALTARESLEDDLEKEEQHQVQRLQNRVLLLQREVQELRGPSERGHLEPTVPEKQFQQLSQAHGKVANHLQALRAQLQAVGSSRSTAASSITATSSRVRNRRMSDPGGGLGSSLDLGGADAAGHVAELEQRLKTETESYQSQLQALTNSNALLRRRLRLLDETARKRGVSLMSDEEPDSDEAQTPVKKPEVLLCEQLLVSERKAVEDLPVPTVEELYGHVQLILAKLQKALLRNPAMKKGHVQELLKKSGDVVIDGRWKVKSILSYSKRMVVALCQDLHVGSEVIVKMSQTLEASLQLAHVDYVLRMLSNVPIVPQVQYCSSPSSSLPFLVMELLQGSTLDVRFQETEAMLELEAAEIGHALLMGMDACHQRQVFNLSLCPEIVWVGPPLEGSRVRILDWSISETGAAVVENPKLYAYISMRKTGLLRGKNSPTFMSGGQEVSPSEIASKRDRKGLLQKLVFNGHGSLYYMSMEQLYQTIRSFERAGSPPTISQSWFQESIGSVVKVEGRTVHWFQKGDGFVQTSQPVTVTPLGQLFEVEVIKAVNLGRKLDCELGFCIGLCSKPPRASDKAKTERQDCWIAGGDTSFYLKGVQRRVGKSSADGQQKYLHIGSDLHATDRVAILAEWSGALSLFVNGEQVGRYSNAIDHSEVVLPLYGVADIFVREASEEYTVRSIGLIGDESEDGWTVQKERMERAAVELAGIHQLLHGEAAVATTIGPSCDLYACGRILLSLFRGGREVLPSSNLDRFAVAYANWAQAGCPPTEKRYGLLWALKELKGEKTERSEDLAQVEKTEVRLVVSRCIKRSRYSRLGSCWEAAEMLASASSWLSMSDDFMKSHLDAVQQAKRSGLLDTHYSLAQELYEQERKLSGESLLNRATQTAMRAAQHRAEGRSVSARWNLRPYTIGPAHIQRILQVIQDWPEGRSIQAVAVSRFQPTMDEELQESLLSCFSQNLKPQHETQTQSVKPKRRRMLRHSVCNVHLGDATQPSLFLEDVRLPSEELPRSVFPLEEILSRNILWLVAQMVRKLDLTPAPPGLGQEKPPSVGGMPGAVETLVAGMARSTILVSLSLRSSCLRDQGVFQLAAAVAKCQTLRELDLSDNNFGAKGAAKVLQSGKEHLEMLDLSRNRLGDAGAKALAEVLLNCHSISVLRLRANGIGDEGGEALAESLMSVTSLREFDFSQNEIHLPTSSVMLRAVCASRGLQRLYLDSSLPWPTSDSFEAQVAGFTDQLSGAQAVPSLQLLSLRRCGLSTSACKLFQSLASNSTLRQLNVSCNGLRQSVAPAIAAALTSASTGLEELDLRDNRLGAQDALAVALEQVYAAAAQAGAMRRTASIDSEAEPPNRGWNNCLRQLNLANNEITATAVSRIAPVLPFFNALEELLLYHNPMLGDAGAQALAEALNPDSWPLAGRGLKTLSLAACSIGDAGCQALMAAARDYQVLTSLDLSCNSITDDSAPAVSLVLAQPTSALESLSLSMNLLSSFGISQLMDGVASNIEGALCQIDVSTQDGGQGKTSFVANDALSPRSSSKVKSKFQGLR